MPNRTAKFASAIFAGLLAGTPLTTISHSAAAEEECLSGPNDKAPGGGHWYYRIDRATKRHCWYQRDEAEKPSQLTPPNSAASARPVAPKPATGAAACGRRRAPRTTLAVTYRTATPRQAGSGSHRRCRGRRN